VKRFGARAMPNPEEWQQAHAAWQRGWDEEDNALCYGENAKLSA